MYRPWISFRINEANLKDKNKVTPFGSLNKIKERVTNCYNNNRDSFIINKNRAYMLISTEQEQDLYAYFEYKKQDKGKWALRDIVTKKEMESIFQNKSPDSIKEKKENIKQEVTTNSLERDKRGNTANTDINQSIKKKTEEEVKTSPLNTGKSVQKIDDNPKQTTKDNNLEAKNINNENIVSKEKKNNVAKKDLDKDYEDGKDRKPKQNNIGDFRVDTTHQVSVKHNEQNIDNTIPSFEMVSVPGNDKIKSFKIAKYVVVQDLYKAIMKDNPSYFIKGNSEKLPVENVTWENAIEFCNKLSERKGIKPYYHKEDGEWKIESTSKGYRLPTREEWLLAACDGQANSKYKYSGSNNEHTVAWYRGNTPEQVTHEVGEKKANKLGLFDMSGNVWEWCWGSDRYNYHFCCGGAFNSNIDTIELTNSSNIKKIEPFKCDKSIGFRIIQSNIGEK